MTNLSFKYNLKFRHLKIIFRVPFIFSPFPININKKRIFNVPLNIFLFNNWKKIECSQIFTFLGTFLSNNIQIAVQKNNLVGQLWYRSLDPVKKTASIYRRGCISGVLFLDDTFLGSCRPAIFNLVVVQFFRTKSNK